MAVDDRGNVVVTGTSNYDYYTAKYAAADGALLWEMRYNGPAHGEERMDNSHSLALGLNGMVAITGSSDGNFVNNPATFDYATVVYREPLPAISVGRVPIGVRLRFTGDPGRTYTIERSLAVTGPWTPINTPAAPIGGLIEYVDANPPVSTAFYRTTTP